MTKNKAIIYSEIINSISGVRVVSPFEITSYGIKGLIEVEIDGRCLVFETIIPLSYPLGGDKFSIVFTCKEINGYLHQNPDGSICLHPSANDNEINKLNEEVQLLKRWMKEYYIDEKVDDQYGYLLLNTSVQSCMVFEGSSLIPAKGSFGYFDYAHYFQRAINETQNYNLYFALRLGNYTMSWTNRIEPHLNIKRGIWIYIEDQPIIVRREPARLWSDLDKYFNGESMQFVFEAASKLKTANKSAKGTPDSDGCFLMLGYKIPNLEGNEVHWELIRIPFDSLPTYSSKQNGKWTAGGFNSNPILWGKTTNCTYDRFFGRGKLSDKIINQNILVIGVGAIGSSLVKHLVRGGVKRITLRDFDEVESGNICRSEYKLHNIDEPKVMALVKESIAISPFVDLKWAGGIPKTLPGLSNFSEVKDEFNTYDFIFDCSTDMEVAYMLDRMELRSRIINLSVTDKANDLVCVVGGCSVSSQKSAIFNQIDPDAPSPSFYPGTGCQYPTFEASYTDLNSLLGYAMKLINHKINHESLRTFTIQTNSNESIISYTVNEY
jgi:hypothetical protein